MPIQIFELTIKMVVKDNRKSRDNHNYATNSRFKEDIIAECSEQVIKYFEQQRER